MVYWSCSKKSETGFNSFVQLLKAGFLLDAMSYFIPWFFALCYWSYILPPFEWKKKPIYVSSFCRASYLTLYWSTMRNSELSPEVIGACQCTLSSQYLWDVLPVCDTIWKQGSKVLILYLSTIEELQRGFVLNFYGLGL